MSDDESTSDISIEKSRISTVAISKPKRVKRGPRKSSRNKVKSENDKMFLIGANAAGIANKMDSLHRIINVFKPAVIFLQETKKRVKNKLKLYGYVVFEQLRTNSAGGGLMTAVHKT